MIRSFEKDPEFLKKIRSFEKDPEFSNSCNFQNHKKGWSRPLTLIMELIINKVRSITPNQF